MKLREYLTVLNQMVNAKPELLDCDIICSSDDEGNSYQHVNYHPTPGVYEGGIMGDFDTIEPGDTATRPNAVCIN